MPPASNTSVAGESRAAIRAAAGSTATSGSPRRQSPSRTTVRGPSAGSAMRRLAGCVDTGRPGSVSSESRVRAELVAIDGFDFGVGDADPGTRAAIPELDDAAGLAPQVVGVPDGPALRIGDLIVPP